MDPPAIQRMTRVPRGGADPSKAPPSANVSLVLDSGSQEDASKSGNIKVVCRFRPLNERERDMNLGTCVEFAPDGTQVVVACASESEGPLKFSFDHIFPPDSLQVDVYEAAAKPIVESVLEGFNGTVFAYGQTGSGKTFTMAGASLDDESLKGIIPRMITTVFTAISSASVNLEFEVKIGYCEIYMERIKDLLNPAQSNLKVREDSRRGVYIADLGEEYVSNEAELYNWMRIGTDNREVAATKMNEGSSRSHSLFIMTISQNNTLDFSAKTGKLYLVDLAGSEKVGKTGAEGKRLDEAKTINKSLSALGMVITALTDGKSTHVPYRDSKLTRVLQDSLGGNSKTSLILTCSPSPFNEAETVSTLRFGTRAKQIKNKPKVNKEFTVAELKLLLSKADAEVTKKERRIQMLEKVVTDMGGVVPPEESMLDLEADESKGITIPTAEMEEIHKELEDAQRVISEQAREGEKMRTQLSEATLNYKRMQTQRDSMTLQMQNLFSQLSQLEEANQDLELKLQTAGLAQESNQQQALSLQKTLTDLQEKCAQQDIELAFLRPSGNKQDAEVQCLINSQDNLVSVQALETQCSEERHRNQEMLGTITQMRVTLESIYAGKISSFEELEADLEEKISADITAQVENEKSQLRQEIARLNDLNSVLSSHFEEAKRTITSSEQEKLKEQSLLNKTIRELLYQSKAANKAYEDQKSFFSLQMHSLEKKIASRDNRLVTLERDLEAVRRELKESREKEIEEEEQPKRLKNHKVRKPIRGQRPSPFALLGVSPVHFDLIREEPGLEEEKKD